MPNRRLIIFLSGIFPAIPLVLLFPAIPLHASPLYNPSFHSSNISALYDAQGFWIGANLTSLLLFLKIKRKANSRSGESDVVRCQSLLESMPLAAALFDRDGCCLDILHTGQNMHKNLLKGHYIHEALPPDSAKRALEAIEKTLDTGTPETFEYALKISDVRQWYEGYTTLARNTEETVLFTCRDITSRKAAETETLQDKERFQSLLRSMGNGVIATDLHGVIRYINPEAERLTGWQHEKAAGAQLSSVFRIVDEASREPAENPALLAMQEIGLIPTRKNLLMIHKDGSEFDIDESAAPISDETGETVGAVIVFHDISGNKHLLWQAGHDELTGLLNRVLLHDRLVHSMASVLRQGKMLAVLFIDLDGFKSVNDNLGHPAGDMLLKEVALRLKTAIRAEDTAARIGGDEFVVLQEASDRGEVRRYLDRIMNTINQPYLIDDAQVSVSPSIGVVLYPEIEAEPEMLLRQADMAMYHAKQAGKNRYHFFNSRMDIARRNNHERQLRISSALKNGEFRLLYQPKINLKNGRIAGFEALIRWQDPDIDMLILPRDFLPAVQDTKLIIDIGAWVIETVLGQIQSWQNQGLDISISINIAGRQLQDPDFPEILATLFEKYPDISPGRLELEIIETTADSHLLKKVLTSCRKIGVRISLDDFGTGYSSLSYLKNLPVDMFKIDQSFVNGMLDSEDNIAIIRSIVSMSKIFKREVIAEGVESIRQGRMLSQMGCTLAQGYGIAEPMPSDDIPQWMGSWHQNPDWMKNVH